MSCNDPLYGQIGCGGNHDGSQYEKYRMPLCNENDCFQEFYNIGEVCFKCNENSPHCSECSYSNLNGSKEKIFKCLNCDEPDYKVLNKKDVKCHKCFVNKCRKCYFDENDNDACEECELDYYVNQYKACSKCYWIEIIGGRFYYCPDKISERKLIECYYGYAKNNTYNCLSCPTVCGSCFFNSQSKSFNFLSFSLSRYYLLNGECHNCPVNCRSCTLSQNNIPICTSCYGGYYIMENNCESCGSNYNSCNGNKCTRCNSGYCLDNGACLKCPDNCLSCTKESNGKIRCTQCSSYYALDHSNNKSIPCPNNFFSCYIKDNELICTSCNSNYILFKNRCEGCFYDDSIGGNSWSTCSYSGGVNNCYSCISNDYSYFSNQYKCLPNTNPEEEVFGCIKASIISGKYECNAYKPGFILIANDKKCKKPEDMNLTYCSNAFNKNTTIYPVYSCNSCINNYYVQLYKLIDNIEITP